MTDLIRWHTEPEETPFTGYSSSAETTRSQKELSELINSNSTRPLYWEIQDKLSSPTNLDREDQEWLQSIGDAFDSYVIKILNGLHIRPWDFDYNIRKEYELEYGGFPPTDLPLRGVMGRLMSYKEIWNYVYESRSSEGVTDWFWRRPQTEPIWTLDCISGGYRNEKTQPFRTTMTGLNPRDLRRAYEVVLERPWTSRLDPVHHWGVYMDQGDNYYKDDPVRILMACCAEHVGHTDGCWIALRGDPTALEGVVKPYQVFPYVFRNVWETGVIPSEDAIKKDVVWGTAFKDYARYESLHNRIQAGLDAAAKAIRSGYGKYQKVLEVVLDSPGSDNKRDRYPYESNAVLSDTERESIASVIRLQYEFNAIQCIGEMPLMADYVNKHIFKVSDMLVHFTYDKMGAELEGVPNEKLKFFSTSGLEDPQKVKAFIDLIGKANAATPANFQPGGKYAFLTDVSKSALVLQQQLEYFKTQQVNYLLLKSLLSDHIALNLKVLNANTLSTLEDLLEEYETRQTETIAKQAEFNTVVENIRNNLPVTVPAENLIQPQPFDAKMIERVRILIEGRKLRRNATSQTLRTPGALPLKPAKLQTIYNAIKQAETYAKTVLQRPLSMAVPERLRPQTQNYFTQYQTTVNDIDNELNDIINTNFPRLITYLTVLNDSLASDLVKEQALLDLGVEKTVINAQNVIQVAETDKIDVETQLQANVAPIIQQYQAEQTQKSDAAKIKLEEMKQSVVPLLPLTQVDPKAEIVKGIKPLLEALPLLIDVDDLNQLGLKYEKRVGEILNLLPTEKEISDTETAKPKENVRGKIIATLNNAQSLYGAAKKLAAALAALLALGGGGSTQKVDNLLDKAEEKAKEARKIIESETERLARLERERLTREAAERQMLEQERLAREQLVAKDKQILEANKKKYAQLDAWIKMQGNVFYAKSDTGLSEKDGLNADDLKNSYTKEEMSWPFFKDGKKLPIEFDVGQLPRTQFPYTKLYLENTTNTIIEQAWKAFGEYVLYKGTSQENAKKEYLKLLLVSYKQALPDQPVYVLDEWIEVDLQKFPKEFNALKMPQDSAFHTKTIVWNLNSCWIDSSFLALFAYPGNILTEHIMTRGKGYFKQRTIVWENNLTPLRITDGCDEQALKNLHLTIVDDIQRIENPLPANPVCPLKTRDEWSKCVVGPLEIDTQTGKAKGPYSLASNVLWTMKQIYKMDDFQIDEYSALDATGALLSTVTVNPNPNTRVYAFNTLYQDGANDPRENLVVLDNDPEFQLGAIISGSGGHFVTYLYDFIRNQWMYINVDKKLENSTWQILDQGLPSYVHNIKTAAFKPYIYLYFKRTDIANLILRNVIPPVDLYIYTSGMGDTWVKSRWEKSIKPWLNTNFPKLNLDITHYDGILSQQDLLKFPPQEKAIAQYLKFPQNHVSNEDDAQKTTVAGKTIEFNTLEGVQKNRYVFFDFAHILNATAPENSNRYTYVAYPYRFGESTFPHLDIFPPFSFDATTKRPKTYIERLIRNEYPVNDINITLEDNKGAIQVKAIEGVKTQIQYFYFLTIVRYFNLIELAKQLDLDGAKTKLRNAGIFTYDEVNGAKSIIPAPTPQGPAPTPTPAPAPQGPPLTGPTLQFSNNPSEPLPTGVDKEARIKELFEALGLDIGIPQQDEIALLDQPWDSVKAYILSLDDIRLEGLLHAWWALRSDHTLPLVERTQRFVVGISRADLDTNVLEGPTPQSPLPQGPSPAAPSPVVITPQTPPPQGPPPIVITPQATTLNVLTNTGLELYPNPKDVVSFEDAFNQAQGVLLNRPELGLGPRFDDIKEIGTDPYRLTGLMHAWWGATQNPPVIEAQVRGMSMADL